MSIFLTESTYMTDYVPPAIIGDGTGPGTSTPGSNPKIPERQNKITQPVKKYTHTLDQFKKGAVPFDLYWRPKEILRTNPKTIQQPYVYQEFEEAREIAIKTRPRIAKVPFINIDDIKEKERRETLVKNIYKTTTEIQMKEAVNLDDKILAPFPGLPAKPLPISLNKVQALYVSPEWRMESMKADRKHLRSYTEPDRDYWFKYGTRYKLFVLTHDVAIQGVSGGEIILLSE